MDDIYGQYSTVDWHFRRSGRFIPHHWEDSMGMEHIQPFGSLLKDDTKTRVYIDEAVKFDNV